MYKLIQKVDDRQSDFVLRVADSTCIPFDPANTDYQAYLKWLEEGNTPIPADDEGTQ
jgi:hypothetical protein